MKKSICIVWLLTLTFAGWAVEPNELSVPKTWAVIISGINKDPDEKQSKALAILQLKLHLKQHLKVPQERLFLMADKESLAFEEGMKESTAEHMSETLKVLSEQVEANDMFIFYYVGQANVVKDTLRLNLPGPDLQHQELVEELNGIKAKQSLIVLDCPAAGLAIKPLLCDGRIVIAGAQANQPWSTRFSQYFIPAMSDEHSDYNQDKQISLLEAFRYAVMRMDDYYRQRDLIKTENPLLEDDGDGIPSQQPWTREKNKDGLLAGELIIYEF